MSGILLQPSNASLCRPFDVVDDEIHDVANEECVPSDLSHRDALRISAEIPAMRIVIFS
jgi:hypothetical protein